jgi:predicted flap endonuclease-1-like 5' DNA nuclease
MDFIRDYWWLIVVVLAIVLAFILLRPRQRVQLTDSAPIRPHMAASKPAEGRGVPGAVAAAASDVTGELLSAPVRRELDGPGSAADDLCKLKGVGPKFEERLRALGFHRYEQLAGLSAIEVERLDEQLGPFCGRLQRDRVIEQADYLARNDVDGFEQKFGKV